MNDTAPKFKGYKKKDKYYWYTTDMLKEKLDKKIHQLESLQKKTEKCSSEINQIENALFQRQRSIT